MKVKQVVKYQNEGKCLQKKVKQNIDELIYNNDMKTEYQKIINLLDNTSNLPYRFRTKK